jgi:flagellar hook assembly protein FlgD
LFFPNPWSPRVHGPATIAVAPERSGGITIQVYDFAMDLVKTVASGEAVAAGQSREFYWDGTNRRGDLVANGVYFYTVEGPGLRTRGKLMVVK